MPKTKHRYFEVVVREVREGRFLVEATDDTEEQDLKDDLEDSDLVLADGHLENGEFNCLVAGESGEEYQPAIEIEVLPLDRKPRGRTPRHRHGATQGGRHRERPDPTGPLPQQGSLRGERMSRPKKLSLKARWDLCVSCAQYVLEDRSERGGELGEVEMAESAQEMSHHILEIERIITGKKVKVRPKEEDE